MRNVRCVWALLLVTSACGSSDTRAQPEEAPPPPSLCGNSVIDSGEACDVASEDYCAWDCSEIVGSCGDGTVDFDVSSEECDDGNEGAADGCADCQVEPGYQCLGPEPCSYGPSVDPDVLSTEATPAQIRRACEWVTPLVAGVSGMRTCSTSPTGMARVETVDECVRSFVDLTCPATIGKWADCVRPLFDLDADICRQLSGVRACFRETC